MFQMLHFTELARIFWMVAKLLFRGCSRAKSWSLDMALVLFKQLSSLYMISLNHKLLLFIAKELIFTLMLVNQKAEDHFQSVWLRGRAVINMTPAALLPGQDQLQRRRVWFHSIPAPPWKGLLNIWTWRRQRWRRQQHTSWSCIRRLSVKYCIIIWPGKKVCRGEKRKTRFNSRWSVCKDYGGFLLLWYQLFFFNVFSISSSIIRQCFHMFILWKKSVKSHIQTVKPITIDHGYWRDK